MSAPAWRGAALLCVLAALALPDARPAHSGILGSAHDFNAKPTITPQGSCSACHLPHTAADSMLGWSRSLADERSYFNQVSTPNYIPDTTLLCYDCHDDNATTISAAVDNDPLKGTGSWDSAREPQDVAFGYTISQVTNAVIPDDDWSDGGRKTGYYELAKGGEPGGGGEPLPAAGSPTGGHYWQSDPNGTPVAGDKIACSICHDPHNARTGSNEAFFVTTAIFPGGSAVALGDGMKASKWDDLTNPNRSRNGTKTGNGTAPGREMCAACHSYSNSGSPVSFGGGNAPKPPTALTQHRSTNTTPCTKCHPHNKVDTSCNECHGFPPLLTEAQAGGLFLAGDPLRKDAESYNNGSGTNGGAGAHQRHKDALGDTVFQCEICLGPDAGSAPWHNQGGGTVIQGNVDIMGESASWKPSGWVPSPDYTGGASAETLQAGYAFKKKGGGDQRCSGLACHGNPPNNSGAQFGTALNWTDDMVDGDRIMKGLVQPYENPNPGEIQICKWCHNAVTPAVIDIGPPGPIVAPGVMGDGSTWGADVNGHGLPGPVPGPASKYDRDAVGDALGKDGAGKDCTACHDARYQDSGAAPPTPANVPYWTHFDSANDTAEKRLKGRGGTTINGLPAANADAVCVTCHQNGATGLLPEGTEVSSHGNDFAGNAEGAQGSMTRACRQCHDVHGANWNNTTTPPRNLFMVAKWIDANNNGVADNAVNEVARVDSDAVNATTNITSADLPVILARRGSATTPVVPATADNSFDDGFNDGLHESVCVVCHKTADMNPTHGGQNTVESTTLQNAGHNPVGIDCMACHDHDYDNAIATADGFAPSGCNGCHGNSTTDTVPRPPAILGQFWPDGDSPFAQYDYADNQVGAHLNHVTAIAWQVYGETPAQVVLDFTGVNPGLTSAEKQKTICAFCHPDPGGAGHSTNVNNDPLVDRVNVYRDADDTTTRLDVFKRLTIGAQASGLDLSGANNDQAYDFTAQSCANLVCHNQAATPVAPNGWNLNPNTVYSAGITSKCSNTTCHAPATYTLAHSKHVGGGVGQKNYECRECHADNAANLQHGNGEVDMQAAAAPYHWNGTNTVEGTFGGANGFYDKDKSGAGSAGDTAFVYKNDFLSAVYDSPCVTIYCHGDDNGAGQLPAADRGTDTTPLWGDALTAACGDCHGASTASPPGSLSHPKHAGGAAGQYAIRCQACHYGTTADGVTIASQALHVNTSVEVSFNTLGDSRVNGASSYSGNTVMGAGYGTCAATYCHSRGNDTVAPYNDVPLSVPIAPLPTWGGAALACSGCHGNPAALPTVDTSMPDYLHLTPKANRHSIHNTTNVIRCEICHYPTTQDGTTIVDTALHVNRTYDAGPKPDAPDTALYQFTWSAPNCNATVCHGGNGTIPTPITWSTGPYTCNVCHGMTSGVVTDTDVDDFAWAGATPTMSKISDSEYRADGGGHGDNTAPNQPNRACADCHDSGTGHDTTAALAGPNPFRLVDQDSGAANVQYSCSYTSAGTPCHTGSTPIVGPQTGIDIATFTSHTPAAMGAAGYTAIRTWPGWLPECANCHDPHGDGNRSMVNRRVYDKGVFPLPAPAPVQPTEQLNLSFTDNTTGEGAASYANSTDFSGICQECHEHVSVVSFHDDGSVSGANHPSSGVNPGDCSICHMHDKGFAPMACKPCHSNPPYAGIGGGTGDDAPVVMTWYDVNGHGSKTFDPDGPGPQGTRAVDCGDCHDIASPSPSTHLTGRFETYTYPGSPWGAPNTNTSHLVPAYFGAVGNERDWQLNFDNNCYQNAFCHRNPPAEGHRHELSHLDGVVRFGDHGTVADAKQARTPPYWTPWTIEDISTGAPPGPGVKQYAPCVACHDPHGADYSGYIYCLGAPDGNYHMVKKDFCDPGYFCNSNCHRP